MTEELQVAEIIKNSSIKVTKREDRSLQTCLLHMFLRLARNHLGRPGKLYPEGSPRLKAPSSARRKCDIVERNVGGAWMYDMTLKHKDSNIQIEGREKRRLHRIYYWAGGGWQSPPGTSHWKFLTALIAELPHTIITVVSYPLAPNSPAPKAIPLLLQLYETLMNESFEKGETVTLGGDSSGGEIVLSLPLEALRQNPNASKPHSILAICPSTDLSRENPMIAEVEKHDPILKVGFINETATQWAGDWDRKDPRISPLLSDRLDLFKQAGIKVDGLTAGYDILGPDGVLFRTKLARNQVEGEWLQWEKMMHCWPLVKVYGISPESDEAFWWMVDLLKRRGEENIGESTPTGENTMDSSQETDIEKSEI